MTAVFCADDIVARRSDGAFGVIERTHADIDTHEEFDENDEFDYEEGVSRATFERFLTTGIPDKTTVLVRWQSSLITLIRESSLELKDRSILIGDIVKRGAGDAMSGVAINTSTRCTLRQLSTVLVKNRWTLPGFPNPDWVSPDLSVVEQGALLSDIPLSELKYAEIPGEEDLVVFKDWIGRVMDVTHKIALKLTDGYVVEIEDTSADLTDDNDRPFRVGDIARSVKGHLRTGHWIYGQYNPNTPPFGTVVQTRLTTCGVLWLRQRLGSKASEMPPEILERDEIESNSFYVYDRTAIPSISPLADNEAIRSGSVSFSNIDAALGTRVRFKNLAEACTKYDGSSPQGRLTPHDRQSSLGYDLNVFEIEAMQTQVTVQWQDLTMTHENSTDLLPDMSIDDEHAAWPGEIVHTLDYVPVDGSPQIEMPSKVGVVQSVKAHERVASVRWCPESAIHYSNDPDEQNKRQEMVVAVVGTAAGEVEDISLYEVEAPGKVNVRRGDIALIDPKNLRASPAAPGSHGLDWLGEIVDTRLDGRLTIRLGAAVPVRDIVMCREDIVVAIRSDDLMDAASEEAMELDHWSMSDVASLDGLQPSHMRLFGVGNLDSTTGAYYVDENGQILDNEEVEDGDWESDEENSETHASGRSLTVDESAIDTASADGILHNNNESQTDPVTTHPQQYNIFTTNVPTSHHFASRDMTETAAHIKRTQKEHRMLSSPGALPSGVYVRTWESRMDLFRVLIIGPDDSPYRNAPFVFDLYLPPQFPNEPPSVHFHSWHSESGLGGVGRVNPNLYEDGKICLSLLGTWSGEQGESWNAAQSTLLQVIVSILGLVLVKEPYYNEAGYEIFVGLESSKRASALYSERVYLRAQSLILTACQALSVGSAECTGLDGLHDVLTWLYRDQQGDSPSLYRKNLEDLRRVLERSENGHPEPDGHDTVSKGACIPLRKLRDRLEGLGMF